MFFGLVQNIFYVMYASEMGVEVKEGMKKRAICARDNEEMEICEICATNGEFALRWQNKTVSAQTSWSAAGGRLVQHISFWC